MAADCLAGSRVVGCWAAELCLSGRGPMGRGLSGRGVARQVTGPRPPSRGWLGRRGVLAGLRGRGAGGLPGWRVAGHWAVSVGLTDRGVVGLRSLICGVLGCRGGLWPARPPARALRAAGSPGRWAQLLGWEASDAGSLRRRDAPGYGASDRRARRAALSGLFPMSPSPVVSSCCVAAYCAAFACALLALCRLPRAAPAVAFRSLARRASYDPSSVELLNHLLTAGSGWLLDFARSPRPVCFSCLRPA